MPYGYNSSFETTPGQTNDPDNVYYNATIINNRTVATATDGRDPQVRFQETRSVPIVQDASKYSFSIIRFTMSGPNKDLPLFIPVIRTGASNPTNNVNLTLYSLTLVMRKNGTTFTSGPVQIIYSPETISNEFAPEPIPASLSVAGQDLTTRYYWVYTYQRWLDLVNAAYLTAWGIIQGQSGATITQAPEMVYDPVTNLFSILSDSYGFGGPDRTSAALPDPANEEWTMFFNSDMFGLFTNFNNLYVNSVPNGIVITPLVAPVDFPEATNQIVISSIQNQNLVNVAFPGTTPVYWWKTTQDFESNSSLWSPIESIVFTSSLLPLVNEMTGDPIIFGESNLGLEQQNSQSAFSPIITDISLALVNAFEYRGMIQYAPTAEYRFASFLKSKQPINNIDVQVFWKNRLDGLLYPLNMFNSSSVTLKILFKRTSL